MPIEPEMKEELKEFLREVLTEVTAAQEPYGPSFRLTTAGLEIHGVSGQEDKAKEIMEAFKTK